MVYGQYKWIKSDNPKEGVIKYSEISTLNDTFQFKLKNLHVCCDDRYFVKTCCNYSVFLADVSYFVVQKSELASSKPAENSNFHVCVKITVHIRPDFSDTLP